MSDSQDSVPGLTLKAEDIAVMNNLLAGLVQSGLPLESGLRAVASDWPGRTGSLIRQLTDRLNQGQAIEEALKGLATTLPVEYVALVRAGLRTGRLPELLDELTTLARMREETRRLAVVSIIYPLLIAMLSVFLGLYLVAFNIPMILDVMHNFRVEIPAWLEFLGQTGLQLRNAMSVSGWFILILSGLAIVFLATWRFGRYAEYYAERLPILGRAWHDARLAYWAQLMALLLEHQTPEAEAIELAVRACGDSFMIERIEAIATMIRTGHAPGLTEWTKAGVPALGAWAVTWPGPVHNRVSTLRMMSQAYSAHARHRMMFGSSLLPIICLVSIGGLFALFYGLLLFLPISRMYRSLA